MINLFLLQKLVAVHAVGSVATEFKVANTVSVDKLSKGFAIAKAFVVFV
jgi:hypothetical protein